MTEKKVKIKIPCKAVKSWFEMEPEVFKISPAEFDAIALDGKGLEFSINNKGDDMLFKRQLNTLFVILILSMFATPQVQAISMKESISIPQPSVNLLNDIWMRVHTIGLRTHIIRL